VSKLNREMFHHEENIEAERDQLMDEVNKN